MDNVVSQLTLLLDLDARHDELLQRVDDLDRRVARTLQEWTKVRRRPRAARTNRGQAAGRTATAEKGRRSAAAATREVSCEPTFLF